MNSKAVPNKDVPTRSSFGKDVLRVAFIALAYFLAHQIAFLYPDSAKIVMSIWPAAGIGLAALLLNRRRLWPAILTALFVSGMAADFLQHRGYLLSAGFMTANILESLGCAWLILRVCGRGVRFERISDVLALTVAAICVNACTSLVGAGTAVIISHASFWGFWRTWWVADGLGILLVAPLIVTWALSPKPLLAGARFERMIEAGTFMALWGGFSWILFHPNGINTLFGVRPYMLMPLLAWPSLRFGQRGMTAALFMLALIIVTGAVMSTGAFPWMNDSPVERLLVSQIFLGFTAVVGLFFTAAVTEKKVLGKAFLDSEEKFRLIVTNSPDHIIVQDRDLRYVRVINPQLGLTEKGMVGKTDFEILSREEAKKLTEIKTRVLETGKLEQISVSLMSRDGSLQYFEGWYVPRRDPEGQIDGIIGYIRNVTAQKQADQMLRASEAVLKKSQEIACLGSWEFDLVANRLVWSDEVYRIFGLRPQEFDATYEAFIEAVHPDDRTSVNAAYTSSLKEGCDGYEIEHRIVKKTTGEVRIVHEKCDHVRDASGKIVRSVGMVQDITGHSKMVTALRESEDRFRSLFSSMQEGFALHDIICDAQGAPIDYRFLDVNPAFEKLTGLKRENLIGKRVLEVLPQTESLWIERYGKVAMTGKPAEFESYTLALDRHYSIVAFCPKKGQFAVIFDDISERKATEEIAKKERALSDAIIESIPGAFYVLDKNGCYVRWNTYQRETIIGKPEGMIAGMNAMETIHPDDQELIRSKIAKVLESGGSEIVEGRVLLHGGPAFRWLLLTGQEMVINGSPHLVGIGIDITERKRMEEALRQANESLAISQRASGAGAWDWDLVTGETQWSPEFFHLMGLEASRVPSLETWGSVLHPEDRQPAQDRLNASVREHRALSSEYRIVLPSGEIRWIHALGNVEYDDRGEPKRMSGFCFEVTARKKAEEELLKLTEAKSKFTSTVSHELRSPLATIKAATDLVYEGLAGPVNEEQKGVLGTAKESIDRLGRLINNVLVYQKMEAGKMGYDIQENDINEFLLEIHKHAELLAGKRSADLVLELGSGSPKVLFDKDKIFQVLINLFTNAIKYSESGKIITRVQLEDREIHVSVQDHGVGIKADNLEEIFDPFWQEEGHQKGGTGLGLAISKEIILAHRGRIWAESEAGEGCTFHFTLPLGGH